MNIFFWRVSLILSWRTVPWLKWVSIEMMKNAKMMSWHCAKITGHKMGVLTILSMVGILSSEQRPISHAGTQTRNFVSFCHLNELADFKRILHDVGLINNCAHLGTFQMQPLHHQLLSFWVWAERGGLPHLSIRLSLSALCNIMIQYCLARLRQAAGGWLWLLSYSQQM